MQTLLFLIGSAAPIILFVGGALAFRGLTTVRKLVLELGLLLISAPLGAWVIGQAFPPLPEAHLHSVNPGPFIIYMYLLVVWLLCFACWLFWLAIVALRARNRSCCVR
jgi:hypothetical protein